MLLKAARPIMSRVSWKTAGALASVAIVTVCIWVLTQLLHDIQIDNVVKALGRIPTTHVLAAIFFVACAYATLSFYEIFALRMIGADHIPYRMALLTSATSFAIGHNLGATAFTAGAVRYRIYSFWGLGLIDVAKVGFLTGLTFWLGNIAALGLGIAYLPETASAIDQLPVWANRLLGFGALAVLGIYLVWAWKKPRRLGRDGWSVALPDGGRTLLQVGIGFLDLACCSLVMYMLIPAAPAIDFIPLAVIVISATLLGFVSHAPGAIGVFDTAIMLALPAFNKEELLAALLLYRLVYFVIPFVLALLVMGYFAWPGMKPENRR